MTLDPCAEMSLLIQAEIDGELDAARAASLAAHRATCADCDAIYNELVALRRTIRSTMPRFNAPESFRASIQAQLRPPEPKPLWQFKSSWRSGFSFGAGALIAATLTLVVMIPHRPDLADTIVSEHIRALQPGHLLDVVSTDQHNVKPWFDGKLDFAPPVKDLAAHGFPIEGGRLDYLDGHAAAAIVYRSRQHPINLFVWPTDRAAADTEPHAATHNGYNIVRWTQNAMSIWVVSDLNRMELNEFVADWRRMP